MGINFRQEFPNSGRAKELSHVRIIANSLETQNLNPRDPNHIQKGGIISSWDFIGFTDIQEGISHTWEPYGSIQGRLSELVATMKTDTVKTVDLTSASKAGSLGEVLSKGSTEGGKYKVDTPLVYTGSQRRQISFTFVLQMYKDEYSDVLEPIHEFRKLSCAGIEGKSVDVIDWPAIFSVSTSPQPFVDIADAALTDVQVTWGAGAQYGAMGTPRRAELTVTFIDLRPLYKSSWSQNGGGVVSVGEAE